MKLSTLTELMKEEKITDVCINNFRLRIKFNENFKERFLTIEEIEELWGQGYLDSKKDPNYYQEEQLNGNGTSTPLIKSFIILKGERI